MTLLENMKSLLCPIFLCFANFVNCDISDRYENNYFDNKLACPYDRVCVTLDCCPGVEDLMNQQALPIHRFRLAVCGYEGTAVKVCCSPFPEMHSTQTGIRDTYSRSGSRSQCGNSFVPFNIAPLTLGSFPFLARIGFVNLRNGEIKYPCTGTIINARTVLTTATCALAQSNDYKLQSVLVGEYDTATNPDCNNMFCGHVPSSHMISYVVKHPGFDPNYFANNIALIRLQEPMNFTVTVQPACVYTGREFNLLTIDEARLFGWGKLASETKPSTQQQALYMRLVSRQECVDFSNRGMCVELCAVGGREPCSGFSGSPLIVINKNKYTVIGILSYGSTCENDRNNPVAFVDLQRYSDWIAQN